MMANLFPSSMDYIAAIENAQTFVLDPVLKHGRPMLDRDGQLICYSGGFTKVFRIAGRNQNSYALRCWTSDIGDAPRRYHAVSKYLAQVHLPFFTEFEYVLDGILVDGKTYPILRMDWVDAPSLSEFIRQHRDQPRVLMAAAESFLVMAKTLHQQEIAHGDLQNDHVKVHIAEPGFHQPTVVRGRVTIFWGHLILAEVAINIRVGQSQGSGTSAPMPSEPSSARRFRRIFASYSHKDLEIVQEMECYSLSLGDRYLRDWVDLRAGERWNERLLGMISEADIFQLFWSRNSSQSLYVEREWRHALSLRRETFIRPTYWEDPCPDPPEPLRPIQFQRLEIGRLLAPQPRPPSKEPGRFVALNRKGTAAPPHPPGKEPSRLDDLIRQRTAPPRESPAPSAAVPSPPIGRRGMRPIVLALVLALVLLGMLLIFFSRS